MKLGRFLRCTVVAGVILMTCLVAQGQDQDKDKRKIIIDQDAAGPAGTDQQAILLLIQSPRTEVLGITVVTGDAWLTEEVAHTLRMLELIGRTDIPVVQRSRVSAGENQRRDGAVRSNAMAPWRGWGPGLRACITRPANWERCRKGSPPPRPPRKTQLIF